MSLKCKLWVLELCTKAFDEEAQKLLETVEVSNLYLTTGVGNHSLLQGIFPTQGSKTCLSHWGKLFTIWVTMEVNPVIKFICDDYEEEKDFDGGISDWRNQKSDTVLWRFL